MSIKSIFLHEKFGWFLIGYSPVMTLMSLIPYIAMSYKPNDNGPLFVGIVFGAIPLFSLGVMIVRKSQTVVNKTGSVECFIIAYLVIFMFFLPVYIFADWNSNRGKNNITRLPSGKKEVKPHYIAHEKPNKGIVGSDFSQKDKMASMPKAQSSPKIILAASKGDIETVKSLIQEGADMNDSDENGFSALDKACSNGHENVVALLLSKGANVNDSTNVKRRTPLHMAAEYGHKDVVKLLLFKGAEVDPRDHSGRSPLHLAAENGHKDVVEFLIAKGAKVDYTNNIQATPLHLAAWSGRKDVVELLLSKGANINAKTWMGISSSTWVEKLASFLTGEEQINMKGKKPNTPLSLAIMMGHKDVIEILKKYGASE